MLLLLPPSEGKRAPQRGRALDLKLLANPELITARERVLSELVELAAGDPGFARRTLGLSQGMTEQLHANAKLFTAKTAPAASIYSGVLYNSLDLASLTGTEKRRANSRILIMSALFGLVRPTDPICAYRLSGNVTLPNLGPIANYWRAPLKSIMAAIVGHNVLVDLRSSTYVGMWPIPTEFARQSVTIKIWQRTPDGHRIAATHHNKSAKGALARMLATVAVKPRTPQGLVQCCEAHGWDVELVQGRSKQLNVTVDRHPPSPVMRE